MMRHSPQRLAFFFILITIARVALFVVFGLQVGWLGYAFAVGLAAGVYVTAYFIRFRETRWPALIGLSFFMLADLWFNEFEMIRTLSAEVMVMENANFIGMGAEQLRNMMQFSALVFGAFPTFAAAVLGWLQSGAEKVRILKGRAWFGRFGLAIAARIENAFPVTEETASLPAVTISKVPEEGGRLLEMSGKKKKGELTGAEKDFIAAASTRQIVAKFGGSDRRARQWKEAAIKGEL